MLVRWARINSALWLRGVQYRRSRRWLHSPSKS